MDHKITQIEYSLKETLNGVKFKRDQRIGQLKSIDSFITVQIPIMSYSNKILNTKIFHGQISSTVSQIISSIKEDVFLLLKTNNRILSLNENDTPFFRMFELREGILKLSNHSVLIARHNYQIKFPRFLEIKLSNLRKLSVYNFSISRIFLESLPFLRYLKLVNTGLRIVYPGSKILEYCNLSNNELVECKVNSKVLILCSNLISKFESKFKFKLLNLSFNPLKTFSADANCLVIKKNEDIKSVVTGDYRIIIADGSKNLKLGGCPNLQFLSVSRCGFTKLSFSVKGILVFKASNNYLQRVPKFKNCRYVNLSGNFLEFFNASSVQAIDLSMNQLRWFNFSTCTNIRHLDITFNPIDKMHSKCAYASLKTIFLNESQTKYFNSDKIKTSLNHQCKACTKNFFNYKMEITFQSIPITVFILFKTCLNEDFTQLMDDSFQLFKNSLSHIDLYCDFSEYIYSRVNLLDSNVAILFTFITTTDVMVKSFHLPALIYNFAEIKRISKPKYLFSFNNSSAWIVAPLLCPIKNFLKKKSSVLSHDIVDVMEILQFTKCFCTKPFYFKILSSPEYFDLQLPPDTSRISLIKKVCKYSEISQDINFHTLNDFLNRCTNLGLSNHDFNKNIRGSDVIAMISHTESPVFVFVRFIFISDRIKLLETEKNNIFCIVDFYCKIFGGSIAEKNYGTYIIKFNILYHAVLFSLKIEHILHLAGIEISIGISSGLIFSSYNNGIMYFGGPVLNKTARMAHLGTGVFCCGCVKLQNDSIYEIFDESERYLKGFTECHRIYSIKLSNKY